MTAEYEAMTFENIINNTVDLSIYHDVLKEQGRVQIDNFLTTEAAEDLAHCLLQETPWDLTYFEDNKGSKMTSEELANFDKALIEKKINEIKGCKPDEYQFLYESYMIVTAYLERRNPDLLLHRFLEQINAPYFLGTMKKITGDNSILKMDAQATRYSKGHFLKEHNDEDSTKGRRFAYVLSLTREWHPDWGGLLHFSDNGKVIDTFMPKFNVLNIFTVPQTHFVSSVAEYAGDQRISLTGWMLNK
ncbi:MAG: SM-20-related protein [Enterobacterales bacterium]|jgi:SM-20-related protein